MGCGSCLRTTFVKNYSRVLWATVLHILCWVLTIVNLGVTTEKPGRLLSWSKFDATLNGIKTNFNLGLLKYQVCLDNDKSNCFTGPIETFPHPGDMIAAGRGVITAYTFAMIFGLISVLILWFYLAGKAEKLIMPRLVLMITNFMSFLLYIVAVSTYYKLCYNQLGNLYGDGEPVDSIMPGFAVALAILVIVMSFFAWGFAAWRVLRPNRTEDTMKDNSGVNLNTTSTSSDMYSPSASTQGYAGFNQNGGYGQNGGFTNGGY